MYLLLCSVFAVIHRLSLVEISGGYSSCGAQLLLSIWDLSGPVSLALAGGFLMTIPPGKPSDLLSTFCLLLAWKENTVVQISDIANNSNPTGSVG